MAGDGAEAIALARADPPDLILMDLFMPGTDGVEATRRIMGESPCAILVVTATVSGHLSKVYQAMGYGALDAIDTPDARPARGDHRRGAAPAQDRADRPAGRQAGRTGPRDRDARPGDASPAAHSSAPRSSRRWTRWSCSGPRPAARRPWPRSSAGSRRRSRPGSSSSSTSTRRSPRGWDSGSPSRRGGRSTLIAEGHRPAAGRGPARRHRRPPCAGRGSPAALFRRAQAACYRPSVDVFFSSVARNWPRPGVAVLLTGMCHDGAAGVADLRRLGWRRSPRTSRPASSGACPGPPSRSAPPRRSCLSTGSPRRSSGSSRQAVAPTLADGDDSLAETAWIDPTISRSATSSSATAGSPGMSTEPVLTQHKVTVLLIDDQPMIGEAVRRMLAGEPDIDFHYCRDAAKALDEAAPGRAHGDPPGPGHARHRRPDPGQEVPGQRADPRDAADRALHQGRADRQGRGVRPRGQRLHRQAARPARAAGADPLSLQGLHQPAPAQRGVSRRSWRASGGWPTRWSRPPGTCSRSCPRSSRRATIRTDWRFVPSAELGGDSFGYHWLDDDHFAFYLLDVSGHGVGSALLSVSAMNALRSQALPQTDFREPGQVLAALNNAFQMDQQNGLFFTIWYGVYHKPTRRHRLLRRRPSPGPAPDRPVRRPGGARRPRVPRPDDRRRSRPRVPDLGSASWAPSPSFTSTATASTRSSGPTRPCGRSTSSSRS